MSEPAAPRDFSKIYDPLHRSILTGNLSGIAHRDDRFEYNVCGGGKFVLWLGSGLHQKNAAGKKDFRQDQQNVPEKTGLPHWILASERIETTRKYLRIAAQIDPRWIESLAGHLIQKTYHEPHWNSETGYVHAYEKVTLFGIVIVPKRRINYGAVDPKRARDIFIQHALVEGDLLISDDSRKDALPKAFAFFVHNRHLLETAKQMQDKLRKTEMIKPESFRHQFYQERLPDEVYDRRSLEKYGKEHSVQKLFMTMSDICTETADTSAFPDQLQTRDAVFDIAYRYAPGETDDGLTVIVPQEKMRQIDPARLGWLVPGLMEQKMTALLKSLPKEIRRQIVPIPDTVKSMLGKIRFGEGDIDGQICKELTRIIGRIIVPADFHAEQLPPELRMNVRVLDANGSIAGEGRDFISLRKEHAPAKETAEVSLPETEFYEKHHREIKTQIQHLPDVDRLKLYAQGLPEFDFYHSVGLLIAARAMPRSTASGGIVPAVQEVTKIIVPLLETYHQARLSVEQNRKHSAGQESAEHLRMLTRSGFLVNTDWPWLQHFPRYFRAVPMRMEKLRSGGEAADRQGMTELNRYWQQYLACVERHEAAGIVDEELTLFRWMIEEYRVSLFAQKLGTAVKVSPQRLDKQLEKVRR